MLDLVLEGLGSWVLLFFLDGADIDPRLILLVTLVVLDGDGSLDWAGEAVKDVEADVHLEGWVSWLALEGTDVSLSMEFRLDKLASKPAMLVLAMVADRPATTTTTTDCWVLTGDLCARNGTTSFKAASCHPHPSKDRV
jgi:hypothetical protein